MANFQSESGRKPIRNQLFSPDSRASVLGEIRFFTTSFTIGGAFGISPRHRESFFVSAKTNGKRITMTEFLLWFEANFFII